MVRFKEYVLREIGRSEFLILCSPEMGGFLWRNNFAAEIDKLSMNRKIRMKKHRTKNMRIKRKSADHGQGPQRKF